MVCVRVSRLTPSMKSEKGLKLSSPPAAPSSKSLKGLAAFFFCRVVFDAFDVFDVGAALVGA